MTSTQELSVQYYVISAHHLADIDDFRARSTDGPTQRPRQGTSPRRPPSPSSRVRPRSRHGLPYFALMKDWSDRSSAGEPSSGGSGNSASRVRLARSTALL